MKIKDKLIGLLGLKGNLPALALSEIVSNTGWNMFEVVWQPYVLGLGATISILGSLTGALTAIRSVLQLIMGRISDCVGRKRLLMVSYILTLIGIILCISARAWIFLVPTIILFSVSGSLWDPIFPTMISESVEQNERGTAFSLIYLTWFVPGFYAPVIAGYIAENYGFRPVLGILLLTEFSAFVVFAAYIKETLKSRKTFNFYVILGSLKEVLKFRLGLSKFYVAVIINRFAYAVGEGIFLGMLLKTFNFTLLQLGILANVVSISAASSQMFVGKLVDRHGSRLFLIVSGGISLSVFAGYLISGTFLGFLICQVFLGLAISTWEPSMNSYLSNVVPEDERGRFFGDLNCLRGLISFPAPILGAFLYETSGFRAPVLASLVLSIIVMYLFISIRERSDVEATLGR